MGHQQSGLCLLPTFPRCAAARPTVVGARHIVDCPPLVGCPSTTVHVHVHGWCCHSTHFIPVEQPICYKKAKKKKGACPTKRLLPVREEGAHGQKGHRARQARRRVGKQDGSRTGAHGHAARAAARGRQPRGREDQTGAPPGAGRCPGHAPAVDLYQDFLLLLRLRFLFLFLFEVPNRTELQKNSRKTGNRELMFS